MIKYLKKLWKKLFGKTSTTLPENIGEKIVEPTPVVESKSLHCITHNRFKKSCPECLIAVGVK